MRMRRHKGEWANCVPHSTLRCQVRLDCDDRIRIVVFLPQTGTAGLRRPTNHSLEVIDHCICRLAALHYPLTTLQVHQSLNLRFTYHCIPGLVSCQSSTFCSPWSPLDRVPELDAD
jgi:hypothetical protein